MGLFWYWVYNSMWSIQRKLVDLCLDFLHKVFSGCHFCGDGCDGPRGISISATRLAPWILSVSVSSTNI